MAIEIERKFLVKHDGWRNLSPGVAYRQGYLCTEAERTVRVRIAGDRAFFTVKGKPPDRPVSNTNIPSPSKMPQKC